MSSWIGKRMKNPYGRIGVVINDSNGVFRILTVEYEDKTTEELWLANIGENPKESQEWCWEHTNTSTQKKEWVEWGY